MKKKGFLWFVIGVLVAAAVVAYFVYKKKTKENFEDFEDCFDDEDLLDEDFDDEVFAE